MDEQAGIVEHRRDRGGDADRAVGDLQELRHDEGGGAHDRRHQLPAGRSHGLDGRSPVRREARLDHGRNGDDADREHVRDRAPGDHAEQRRAHHRDLGGAAAEAAHRRHGDVGEEIGAAGARQHLAQDGERDDDQHRYRQDRADDAVDVEPVVDDQPFRRDVAGLEVAGQVGADVDVDRHCQDDADEAPARHPPARLQHQGDQDRAADDALARQQRDLVGQGLVAHCDVSAEDQRSAGGNPIDAARREGPVADQGPGKGQSQACHRPRRHLAGFDVAEDEVGHDEDRRRGAAGVDGGGQALLAGDEGERQREPETDREQLLGVERDVEYLAGDVEHPHHDHRDQRGLQDVGRDDGRARGCGGELRRVGDDAFLGGGAVNDPAHMTSLGCRLRSWKYLSAPGW